MVELHIFLEPQPGKEKELYNAFLKNFKPAVSSQKGFVEAVLLKPHDSLRAYTIALRFESEELRQRWASSEAHEDAFPRLAALCSVVAWRNHDVVGY